MTHFDLSKTSLFKLISITSILLVSTSAHAQYKDPLAFELKGPVKSCQVYNNKDLWDSYTFDTNGKWLTYHGCRLSMIFKEINRDANNRLIYAQEFKEKPSDEEAPEHTWTYDDFGRVVFFDISIGDDIITRYEYTDFNSMGCYTKRISKYGSAKFDNYEYDSHGNWIKRRFNTVNTMTRIITYYSDNSSSSTTSSVSNSWITLKMKKLSLTYYGLIGANNSEANRFSATNGEYIELLNSGRLIWNNRGDGNTSYNYQIKGNRLYITAIGNSPAGNKWFDIVSIGNNVIKTTDNIGTYRYFTYQ